MVVDIIRFFIHYGLHFLFPGVIAYVFYRDSYKQVWLILLLTMLVDLDHLLAVDIFEANRCSINSHPLHSYYAISIYFLMLFFKKTRVVAIGLLLHMVTDFQDCLWMN